MIQAESCAPTIARLLRRYGLEAVRVAAGAPIPGSYWGESEAGLIGTRLYYRADTPLHSVLHEAAHFVCMCASRRATLVRDAGGDHPEENAVCYLQIVLAQEFAGVGRERMCREMDEWGYTFRLGSAAAWFQDDAHDARQWLIERDLLTLQGAPTWRRNERGAALLR